MFVKTKFSEFHYSCLFTYKVVRFNKLSLNLNEPKTHLFSIDNLELNEKIILLIP